MTTLKTRAKTASRIVRDDTRDFLRTRRHPSQTDLDGRQRQALADLKRDGFAVVEGYWPREQALSVRDRLTPRLEQGADRDYDSGAYLRFYDDNAYDQGVRRLFHVERELPELAEFRADPFVLGVAAAYYRMPFHSGLLMYQYNTQSNDNTRYYHVDSFIKEAKSFMYLDDVDEGNGPFTYLRGSHRSHFTRIKKQVVGNEEGAATSFHPDDVKSRLDSEVQICGPAGTLIITDVRGLHRGSPQREGDRSVLVNYVVRHEGDLFPGK
jgi:phytanoyl-CoA dioxygenase PhyH